MAKNVMKLLKPSPHRSRNDFDLSHRHVFDANFGEILPATCIETVPGDNITLHASDLIRNIPFVNSPFLRAKQHLDVWFVPYHDLWHQFDAFITKKSEPVSAAFKSAAYCPWFSQFDLYDSISRASGSQYNRTDIHGRPLTDRSWYLLELLGYGDVAHAHGTLSDSYKVNPFRLAAYNYIWYNEYRQNYYDDGSRLLQSGANVASLFNFDDLGCDSVANAQIKDTSVYNARLSAMAQMRYRTWKKDLFTGVMPSTQFGNVSTIGVSGSVQISGTGQVSGNTGNDYSRHGYYRFAEGGGLSHLADGDISSNVLWLEKRKAVSDMINGQDDHNDISYGLNPYPSGSGINYEIAENTLGVVDLHTHQFTGNVQVSSSGSLSGGNFDVLALRRAEAVQIWRENALRAGNRIKDNMMAHYGVASDFNDHRPTYLGSVSAPLNISDIATTANSSSGINDTVGDIAGKGLSSLDERVFKFHAKDFGVIMVMFSMLPEAEYDALGIERTNQLLEPEDFFTPEYENLGLESVGVINIYPRGNGAPSNNSVFGFAPRYYGYKTKIDRVFGQFVGNGIFRSWSSQRSDVSATLSQQSTYSMPLNLLYVNPAIFDSNFATAVSISPQFLCDIYFDVDAVRPMSVIGLPFS